MRKVFQAERKASFTGKLHTAFKEYGFLEWHCLDINPASKITSSVTLGNDNTFAKPQLPHL